MLQNKTVVCAMLAYEVAVRSILMLKKNGSPITQLDGHSHSRSQKIALGVDGPLVMVSVLSACGPVTSEKNLMKLSVHQFGKKILKLMAR